MISRIKCNYIVATEERFFNGFGRRSRVNFLRLNTVRSRDNLTTEISQSVALQTLVLSPSK
ncbi:hypothetical protein [Chlorogloea sp. CCALA 695]|uniref:hypothetical protein n=1 Tax=Chlorogloea sp. CCALA 695 TaxID=2107693 RepID=UPI0011B1DA19|nr:hypothetical protein [Chlorogloea sp. CCALA 695]